MTGTAAAARPRRNGHRGPLSGARGPCAPSPCAKATRFAAFEPEQQVSARGAPFPRSRPRFLQGHPPPAASSSALRSLMLPRDLLSPSAVAHRAPSVPSHPAFCQRVTPVLEPELGGRSGEKKGAEQPSRSGGTAWKGGRGYPHAQQSRPALGVWSTPGVPHLVFLKPASGNSLGLGFSHVYLKADVILCQP